MFCGGERAVGGGGVPRGGEDCQVGEQSISGQQIIHTQCNRGRVTHTNWGSKIVKIVYLESSLAQGITVEMELNIYSQFHYFAIQSINFNRF